MIFPVRILIRYAGTAFYNLAKSVTLYKYRMFIKINLLLFDVLEYYKLHEGHYASFHGH